MMEGSVPSGLKEEFGDSINSASINILFLTLNKKLTSRNYILTSNFPICPPLNMISKALGKDSIPFS